MPETRPSPELAAIALRWIAANVKPDGAMMSNLLAREGPVLFCGTSVGEAMSGDTLRAAYRDFVNETPAGRIWDEHVEAYETGPTGWAHLTSKFHLNSHATPLDCRVTLVFVMEQGIWRVQHIHNSFAHINMDVLGYEHHTLDALVDAAQSSDLRLGHSGSATVMFTDIADSSALAEAIGDTRWSTLVQQHIAMIRTHLDAQKGRLIKSLGDGTMSTFTSASAGMRAALAIQAALAAQTDEPRLRVRIGLHTGDVVEAGDDFFGSVVNKAARIAAATRPGDIRVSDATRIMVGGSREFVFCDAVTIPLKGLEGEHPLYRLERPPPDRPAG